MSDHLSSILSNPWENRIARWLALAGVGPILFVAVFTIAGFLRQGYSPLRQSISTLGVGTNAWLVNMDAVIFAVLLLAFGIGFFLEMRQIMRKAARVACLVLFILSSVGIFNAAIFSAASGTAGLHWTIGFLPAFLAPVAAYLVSSWQWRRVSGWRGYGWYSLATALGVVVLIVLSFVLLAPRSASGGPSSPVGGLIERVLVLVAFAWPVVIGWRLFIQARWNQQGSEQRTVGANYAVGQLVVISLLLPSPEDAQQDAHPLGEPFQRSSWKNASWPMRFSRPGKENPALTRGLV